MPKLSVIVPVYNVEAYLPACIDSVLSQTFRDLELILIDDGSPDNCGRICDEYAKTDKRVRVLHQENRGVSAARNAGLRIASGEMIGFVDPDDWIAPEMYEILLKAVRDHDAQIAVCGFLFCDEAGKAQFEQAVPGNVYDREALLLSIYGMPNQLHGSMCNKIFSKSVLEGVQFDETVAIGEDWLMLYACYCSAERAAAVPDCLYFVRGRSGSATRKESADLYVKKIKAYLRLYEKAANHSKRIRQHAAAKILDVCIANKNEIQKQPDNESALSYVNQLLRRLSRRSLLRGELPLKKAVYYYKEGLRS